MGNCNLDLIYSINNFNKLKSNVYNLGLSSANLTKYMLAKKIKNKLKFLKIKIIKNKKDPDQRDYYVSNKKIEQKGFRATTSGITEQFAFAIIFLFLTSANSFEFTSGTINGISGSFRKNFELSITIVFSATL